MKDSIIYISINKDGSFQAEGQFENTKIGMSTDDVKESVTIIESVNSSLFLLKTYHGSEAVAVHLFLEKKMDYEEFAKIVGGREKVLRPTEMLPIMIKVYDR